MPVHRVRGRYRWGRTGHLYSSRAEAERQARAIYASGYKGDKKHGTRKRSVRKRKSS